MSSMVRVTYVSQRVDLWHMELGRWVVVGGKIVYNGVARRYRYGNT